MPLTYADVMSRVGYLQNARLYPYTGYNAILYTRWLPYVIVAPIVGAISMMASLFWPWLSHQNPKGTPIPLTGFQIANNLATFVVENPGNHSPAFTTVSFGFPFLWVLLLVSVSLVILAIIQLVTKTFSEIIVRLIKITFGCAFLLQMCYLGFVLTQADILPAFSSNGSIPVGVDVGFWLCLLSTAITSIISLILFSNLSWHWRLAIEDIEVVAKKTNFQPF